MPFTDKTWLISTLQKIGNRASSSEIEAFLEKVAVIIDDLAVDEFDARWMAFNALFVDKTWQ